MPAGVAAATGVATTVENASVAQREALNRALRVVGVVVDESVKQPFRSSDPDGLGVAIYAQATRVGEMCKIYVQWGRYGRICSERQHFC